MRSAVLFAAFSVLLAMSASGKRPDGVVSARVEVRSTVPLP